MKKISIARFGLFRSDVLVLFASFIVSVILGAAPLHAASYTWAVSSGDWSIISNWGGSHLPTGSDTAFVVNGGTVNVTQLGETCGTLSLGSGAGSGTLQLTGGSLYATSNEYVGNSGTGTFTQSGGTNNVVLNLLLGSAAGSSGTYNLSGNGLLWAEGVEGVGYSGAGSFTQSGGINSISYEFYLGYNAGSSGTYNLAGGALSAPTENVGNSGTGSFTQSGGTNNIFTDGLCLGGGSGSTATYSLSGSGWLSAASECVGSSGTGSFTQSGGTNSTSSSLTVGAYTGGSGTYSLSGSGRLLTSVYEYVGDMGTGVVVQSGGTNSIGNLLLLGYNTAGNGTYNLNAGQLAAPAAQVGGNGMGNFLQSGGTNNIGNILYLGLGVFGRGTYSLSGSGQLAAACECVGNFGTGVFAQSGGTNDVGGSLVLGNSAGSSGTYNLDGGLLILSSLVKGPGTAAFNFNGGTLLASGSFSTALPMTLGASGSGGATFDTAGFVVTLSGSLSGLGSLTKIGTGTLLLTGSNTYSGSTMINSGKLTVDGSLLSPVTVNSGGILGGTGSLSSGTVSAGGQVDPGDPLGVLHFSGNLVLEGGAALDYELDAPGSGDELQVSGLATLNGTLNVSLMSGFTPSAGQSFDLINGSTAGSFTQVNLPALGNGQSWNTSSLYANGTISVVPEPSTLALLGVAALGLAAYAWRRRAAKPILRVGILMLLWLVAAPAGAQTLATLLSFSGTNGAYLGQGPTGDLTLSGSTLYGMTGFGGTNGDGNIFSVNTSGSGFQNLVSFNSTNGQWPGGNLILGGPTLYGTTPDGGTGTGSGTVFSIPASGGTLTTLLSFSSGTMGNNPQGGLTLSGSTLFGTTAQGGSNYGGTLYSIPVTGGTPTVLYPFAIATGDSPSGALTLSNSTLYGMTVDGGTDNLGTIFKINTDGTGFRTLFSFSGTNGKWPGASLTLCNSTLYGMTDNGGSSGYGTLFKINTDGTGFQSLLSFTGTSGAYLGEYPHGSLTLVGSALYGTTVNGGTSGQGNVFRINTSGGGFQNLLSLSGSQGANPYGSLALRGSTLFGMTESGGTGGDGTLFALSDPTIIPPKITLGGMSNATIISGGTAMVGMIVSNSPSSTYSLNYTLNAAILSGSATLGAIASGTGSLAPSASQSCTVSANSTTLDVRFVNA